MQLKKLLNWTIITPILAWVIYFATPNSENPIVLILCGVFLMLSVFSAVHHSEVIAHKVGEPFGTLVLAISITVIEVALIISLMLAGGNETSHLARDTVFAAVMIILNGVLGMSLLVGSVKFHEQFFARTSANSLLVALIAILVLTLILPNFTTSIKGPVYTEPQLIFVSIACLVIYGTFLLVQTVRHRNYFLPNNKEEIVKIPSLSETIVSFVSLIVCLGIVVLMAKKLSPSTEQIIRDAGLPQSLVGVIIAAVILLPEGIAAIKAARKDDLQTSLNLSLGSALASIGLTIPAVATVCSIFHLDLVLGLDYKSMVLLGLSFLVTMLSLSRGKTNILYGVVLLVNLAAYIFTVIYP